MIYLDDKLISCGFDDVLRMSYRLDGINGMVANDNIHVGSKPKALALGTNTITILTVSGICFVVGKYVFPFRPYRHPH